MYIYPTHILNPLDVIKNFFLETYILLIIHLLTLKANRERYTKVTLLRGESILLLANSNTYWLT